jgi:hypothetical protein
MYILCKAKDIDNDIWILIGINDYYDMWIPGSSMFKMSGLGLSRYPIKIDGMVRKKYKLFKKFKTVDDFKKWLFDQYFEYFL